MADRSVDIVFASACVHHAEDPEEVFNEIRRILKPAGLLILLNERVVSRLLPQLKDEVRDEYEDAHESAYFYSEWTHMLRNTGFQQIKPLRPRFMTAAVRYRERFSGYRPGSIRGYALQAYMMARVIVEKVPLVGRFVASLTFPWEREYIGDVSYSCMAIAPRH